MNKKLLLSLALAATMVTSASAAGALSKNARSLPANAKLESVKAMDKLNSAPLVLSTSLSETVVTSQNLKNGNVINYVKCADGMVRKQLVTKESSQKLNINKFKSAGTKAVAPSFYESFDSYDGKAYDWIPANWQDISKKGYVAPGAESDKLNLTWCVSEPMFEPALDGDYLARCQVSVPNVMTGDLLVEQDEWLISPSVKVGTNENLYFYLGYKPSWTLLNMETMEFTSKNNLLDVLVSEDGGTTWEKQWDNYADALSYTTEELWEDAFAMTSTWIYVPVKLKKYEGKNIKIAFRYYGIDGESVHIDGVTVSAPNPVASYIQPRGFFYWGLSNAVTGYDKFLVGAAYADATWLNTSSLDSETFKWDYVDPMTDAPATSSDVNLTIYSPFNQVDGPILTASAEGATPTTFNNVALVQTGSSASNKGVDYGACTYDMSVGGLTRASYFGSNGDANWTKAFGFTGDDNAKVKSLANFFGKPEHSYYLSKVWIQSILAAEPDVEFTMTLKKVGDDGIIGDVIATGKTLASEAIVTGQISTLEFFFTIKDPITGLEEDAIFNIDSAVFMELTWNKPEKITDFTLLWIDGVTNPSNCNAYVSLDLTQAGVTKARLLEASAIGFIGDTDDIYCTNFCFNTDATFTWFETAENEFNAPNEGGSKTFDVNAYFYSSAWSIAEEDEGTLPEWISYSATDDKDKQTSTLTFNVEALPNGITGRSFDVTVNIPGSTKVFKISQGDGSVGGVTVSDIKVTTVGGDFAISYPTSINAVTIYNVSGQLVKDVKLVEAGNSTVSAKDLAKGVYILKFNDNRTVKVIK